MKQQMEKNMENEMDTGLDMNNPASPLYTRIPIEQKARRDMQECCFQV